MITSRVKSTVVRTIDLLSLTSCVALISLITFVNCAPHCYPSILHSPLSKHDAFIFIVLSLPITFYCVAWFVYKCSKLLERHAGRIHEATGYTIRQLAPYFTVILLVSIRFILRPYFHWLLGSLCSSSSS